MNEPVQLVRIRQPFCTRTFGVAPCTATGVPCYNTRSSCKDPLNFQRGALDLWFSRGRAGEIDVPGVPVVTPSLLSVSAVPTQMNLGGANPDMSGIGTRASVTITFRDHPDGDLLTDPYRAQRLPGAADRGSFWLKWLSRNRYRQNIEVDVYDGFAGQHVDQMIRRRYFLQEIGWPDDAGLVQVVAQDVLTRLLERKAQAPVASPGELLTDIGAGDTSFTVTAATISDYPATGTLRIDDELMTYSGRSAVAAGVLFTGVTRGTDRTAAATHSAEAAVQRCLRWTEVRAIDVLQELLVTWAGVPAEYLDNWTPEFNRYLTAYVLTTVLTEPKAVGELVSEILQQIGAMMWWDDRVALIRFRAIRGIDADPPVLTEQSHIMPGLTVEEMPEQRVSEVWFAYRMRDFTGDEEKAQNFETTLALVNPVAATPELYGERSVLRIFSRWITSRSLALYTATKILNRYVDIPRRVRFRLATKDRLIWVGDTVEIRHHRIADDDGNPLPRFWTITAADERPDEGFVELVAEDTTLYGVIFRIMPGGTPNYGGARGRFDAYIGNSAGLLGDGTPSARIG
jgi:hypothetical protein